MANSIQLHRVLSAPPEKVFRAFSDPDALSRWLPPHGFTGKVMEMDFNIGGSYKMSFTNFTTGQSQSFGGKYLEIIKDKLLTRSERFDNPDLKGEMRVTVTLTPVSCGTDLKITQEGIPEQIPLEFCYLGWQQSLNMLALIVEPHIPN